MMKRNRNNSGRNGSSGGNPCPFSVGMKIRPIANFGRHSYQQGKTYVVTSVDSSDSTLKAQDSGGTEGNWIRWDDCQVAEEIGWEWLKQMLPAEALDLLSNFDGLDNLRLNEEVRTQLLLGIPDLKNRILEVRERMENESLTKVASGGDGEEDDEDEDPFGGML
jgi:hypothetical protein